MWEHDSIERLKTFMLILKLIKFTGRCALVSKYSTTSAMKFYWCKAAYNIKLPK